MSALEGNEWDIAVRGAPEKPLAVSAFQPAHQSTQPVRFAHAPGTSS